MNDNVKVHPIHATCTFWYSVIEHQLETLNITLITDHSINEADSLLPNDYQRAQLSNYYYTITKQLLPTA